MSIADKITSIEGHLTADYESLENLGADLTNVNKNIQNIRTCLDTIYDNLPKTTGEGSNLSLTTLKGRINVDDILGDTQQDSTTGYNILNFNSNVVLEDNILSTDKNAGRILASDIQLQANTTYYFKFILLEKPTASTTITSYIDGTPDTTIGQGNIQGYSVGTLITKQITPTSNCILSMAIWGNANVETIKFQYWVTTDNSKNTFEPYTNGASPNPTYPQDINVVTGTQEVVVQNKNLCDGQFRQGGWHDSSGPTRLFTTQNLVVEKGKTYTISTTLDTTRYKYGVVVGSSPYPQTINPNIYDSGWNTTSSKTITFNVSGYDIGYLGITIATANGTDNLTPSDIEGVEWQVEYGSNATTKVEHQEQTKTLHLGDIELAKIGTYQDRIFESSGKNKFSSLIEIGSYDNTTGLPANNGSAVRTKTPIEVTPSTTYTLSNNLGYHPFVYEYGENDNFIQYTRYDVTTATFTTSATTKYIRVRTNATNVENKTSVLFMLNLGSSALPYEPYGSDKWYIEKNIGKYNCTGNETWRYSVSNVVFYADMLQDLAVVGTSILCNYFTPVVNTTQYADMANGQCKAENNTLKRFACKNTTYSDVTNFQNWLKSINMNIYYQMATPTYTEITNETLLNELNELEKMMSYSGQTNISVSGNLPMILDVTALKGE